MILGIDASNILAGGGVAHLQNLLNAAQPQNFGIEKVIIWGGRVTLENLRQYNWLDLRKIPSLNRSFYFRLGWKQSRLSKLTEEECDLLFIPGGLYLGNFRPYVTMFQNMQIFETKERNRESNKEWLRLKFLQLAKSTGRPRGPKQAPKLLGNGREGGWTSFNPRGPKIFFCGSL